MIGKIGNFYRKSPRERRRAVWGKIIQTSVRCFGPELFNKARTYAAYHPDSHVFSSAHEEFDSLFQRFTAHNELNNGGDAARLWSLILNVKQVLEEGVSGDFAELGVWRGNTAAVLAHFAAEAGREIFLFDTFQGFDEKDITGVDQKEQARHFSDTSMQLVRDNLGSAAARSHLVPGYFPESITPEASERRYAVVSLDCDLYKPMKAGLEFFYPRLNRGGALILHDYSSPFWDGAKKAVDEFCASSGELITLWPDKSGSAVLRKTKA